MMTAKQLKEEILAFDIINTVDEEGNKVECVEVIFPDRVIDVYMDIKEVNIGILVKKIIEDNLYIE